MNKEIFTTDDMNEIVSPIHKAAEVGNPVAKLVFGINDAINSLKPGRPISKAERDRIEFMWDNLIVGMANETRGIAEQVVTEDEIVEEGSFLDILRNWDDAYSKKNNVSKEAVDKMSTTSEGKWQLADKDKLYALEIINKLIAGGLCTEDVAELFRTDNDTIIGIIQRNAECENKLFEAMTNMGYVSAVATGEELIDAMDDVKDECSGECGGKCSCRKSSSNDLSDDEAEEAIKEVYKLLKEVDSKITERSKTVKFPGGWYKKTTVKVDSPNKYREIYSISDIIRHMFDF